MNIDVKYPVLSVGENVRFGVFKTFSVAGSHTLNSSIMCSTKLLISLYAVVSVVAFDYIVVGGGTAYAFFDYIIHGRNVSNLYDAVASPLQAD